MTDPTVELSAQDEREFQYKRHDEIAAICWTKCDNCNGRGSNVEHWEADDNGPEYVLCQECPICDGEGQIQLHDSWRVEALYDAADDAREEFGVWCYTRIVKGLALAIDNQVILNISGHKIKDKKYTVTEQGCNCFDAYYRAPKINDIPHCKHQIAVLLVKAAEHKMYEDGEDCDAPDAVARYEAADRLAVEDARREAQNV